MGKMEKGFSKKHTGDPVPFCPTLASGTHGYCAPGTSLESDWCLEVWAGGLKMAQKPSQNLTYRYCPHEKLDTNEEFPNSSLSSHKYLCLNNFVKHFKKTFSWKQFRNKMGVGKKKQLGACGPRLCPGSPGIWKLVGRRRKLVGTGWEALYSSHLFEEHFSWYCFTNKVHKAHRDYIICWRLGGGG